MLEKTDVSQNGYDVDVQGELENECENDEVERHRPHGPREIVQQGQLDDTAFPGQGVQEEAEGLSQHIGRQNADKKDDDEVAQYCEQEMILEDPSFYSCDLGELRGKYKISWTYEHKDGSSNIDVYVMDELNKQQYENDNSFIYIAELTREDTKSRDVGTVTVDLDDTYYFIIDHSDAGKAQPDWGDEVHFYARIDLEKSDY